MLTETWRPSSAHSRSSRRTVRGWGGPGRASVPQGGRRVGCGRPSPLCQAVQPCTEESGAGRVTSGALHHTCVTHLSPQRPTCLAPHPRQSRHSHGSPPHPCPFTSSPSPCHMPPLTCLPGPLDAGQGPLWSWPQRLARPLRHRGAWKRSVRVCRSRELCGATNGPRSLPA